MTPLFLGCASLMLGPTTPPAMLSPKVDDPALCFVGRGDLAGRFEGSLPEVGISRRFGLARAHGTLGLDLWGLGGARVLLAATRSGGTTGYIGIDGESLVPKFLLAEARFTWQQAGFTVAAGLVDDPWVITANQAYGIREIAPTVGQERGFFARSDLGVSLAWTSPLSIATVHLAMLSGEGTDLRERNNGFNTTGMLTLRPLAPADLPRALAVTVLARDGSRGVGSARDHRGALRVASELGPVRFGWEGMKAWGFAVDGEREPGATSVWATLRDLRPALASVRLDLYAEDLDAVQDTGSLTARVAGGVVLPPLGDLKPIEVLVGWEGRQYADAVAPLAGAESLTSSHTFFVQLGFLADFSLRVAGPPTATVVAPGPESPDPGVSP